MNRRGLSLVITTLILIVLVLVAIAIIWVVVSNILKGGTEGVALGTFTVEVDVNGTGRVLLADNDGGLRLIKTLRP